MHTYIKDLYKILDKKRNLENAAAMKKYMREQFDYFGIKMNDRRDLCKQYMNSRPLPEGKELRDIVKELWQMPERDFQYFAVELMMKCKKQWKDSDIKLFEKMITQKSWWDTVDFIANQLVGPWLKNNPDQIVSITGKWNNSDNIWLQRMSLLFQLKYKKDTDTDLMFKYIRHLSGSEEFFVQKAIGWILREYSKTDPVAVKKFISETKLKPLSRREGLKLIDTGS